MALKLLQSGFDPISLDGYDADYLTIKGGEVGRLTSVAYVWPQTASSDKASADCYQGFANKGTTRSVVTHTFPEISKGAYRPLYLLDEGTNGYGLVFGSVVGGVIGQVVPNPSDYSTFGLNLGLHTAYGSGKVTCWDKPGLYATTLDAVAHSVTATGSQASPGDALYVNTSGQLTLTPEEAHDFGTTTPTIVGRFMEFSTDGSLVTTKRSNAVEVGTSPASLVATRLVFQFQVE